MTQCNYAEQQALEDAQWRAGEHYIARGPGYWARHWRPEDAFSKALRMSRGKAGLYEVFRVHPAPEGDEDAGSWVDQMGSVRGVVDLEPELAVEVSPEDQGRLRHYFERCCEDLPEGLTDDVHEAVLNWLPPWS